jgi:CheY-like chemotaxis protein
VLVVENSPERIAWFRQRFSKASLTVATRAAAAQQALSKTTFHEVWLDFDLDGMGNGADVAFVIARLPKRRRPARVVVHSANLAGALSSSLTLKAAKFTVEEKPFPSIVAGLYDPVGSTE